MTAPETGKSRHLSFLVQSEFIDRTARDKCPDAVVHRHSLTKVYSKTALKLQARARVIATAACLALTPWTAYAGIINGCSSGSGGPGTVCQPPIGTPPPGFIPLTGPSGNNVFYFWSGSNSNNLYAFTYEIENDTNRVMTDLHLLLAYNDLAPPLGPVNINFPLAGATSDVFTTVSLASPIELDFVGGSLASSLSTIVNFSIDLPANNPDVGTFRGLRIQANPTFDVPEPSTIGLLGAALVGLGLFGRRRDARRYLQRLS